MENDFEDFVNERISHNYSELKETRRWKKESKEFNSTYFSLYKELNTEQQKMLEKIIESKNSLMYFESQFAYKLAIKDIMMLFKM